jgi:hypothetical protein
MRNHLLLLPVLLPVLLPALLPVLLPVLLLDNLSNLPILLLTNVLFLSNIGDPLDMTKCSPQLPSRLLSYSH